MNTKRPYRTRIAEQSDAADSGTARELVATVTLLLFIAIAAASLFIGPSDFHAAASPQIITESAPAADAERPFHERYPIQAADAPIDPPTF